VHFVQESTSKTGEYKYSYDLVWSSEILPSGGYLKKKSYYNPKQLALKTERFFPATYIDNVLLSQDQLLKMSELVPSAFTPLDAT
jgi:hypothetical protein